jgi:hypothetical protein
VKAKLYPGNLTMKIIDHNFPSEIKLNDLDIEIYEEFLKIYQDLKVSSETAVIFD